MQLGNNAATWNIIGLLAIVIGVGAFGSGLVFPVPDSKANDAAHQRKVDAAQESVEKRDALLNQLGKAETEFWTGASEVVTPQILEKVTALAEQNKIRIRSFRPQRGEVSGEIGRLKYVVLLEGKFADATSFARGIEAKGTKVGLGLMQIAGADGETDRVNATLMLVAYTQLPVAAKPAESKGK